MSYRTGGNFHPWGGRGSLRIDGAWWGGMRPGKGGWDLGPGRGRGSEGGLEPGGTGQTFARLFVHMDGQKLPPPVL